jgi:hypothetical protein
MFTPHLLPLIMPAVLDEFLAAIKETWRSLWSLSLEWFRLVMGGIVVSLLLLIAAWQFMVPLMLLAIVVVTYLRHSRDRDAL